MTKVEFITAYVLARAFAISGSVTGAKLVASAATVWQEIQYETGAEVRPVPVIEEFSNVIGFDPATGEIGEDDLIERG